MPTWAAVVVELGPITDNATCMLLALEAVTMCTLLFQSADHSFDHAVLLWAVWCDELLLQAVAAHETCVRLVETKPLSERSRNGLCTRPSPPRSWCCLQGLPVSCNTNPWPLIGSDQG